MAKILHSSAFLPFDSTDWKRRQFHSLGVFQVKKKKKNTVTCFSFFKVLNNWLIYVSPGVCVTHFCKEISDKLLYILLCSFSFWARNSHRAPFELRHDCFLPVGGFLFSSVHISVGSWEHHYLLSRCLFPKGKREWGMLIKQQWIANQLTI